MKIILGSSSIWRKNLFKQICDDFETAAPDIDEKAIRHADPRELTLAIARAKGVALQEKIHEPCILITSDQVVVSGDRILEKPQDEAEARQHIARSSIEPTETVTSVVVTNTATGQTSEGVDIARHWSAPLPPAVVDAIIAKGEVYTCSGGFDVLDPLVQPYIKNREGDMDSIVGLPLKLTRHLIERVGGPILPASGLSEQPLIKELLKLHLPTEDFAIFGSGPLMARGLRESHDLDIVARGTAWQKALTLGRPEPATSGGQKISLPGNIDLFNSWGPGSWDVNELIDSADSIAGLRFVRLPSVQHWKETLGRPKDQGDLELIKQCAVEN